MKVKGKYFMVLWLTILLISLLASVSSAQQIFQMQAYDTKTEVLSPKIEVLSPAVFEARFGNNKHIPRTEEAILALAQKLYPSQAVKQAVPTPPGEIRGDCGEEDLGLLFAALQNPAVSDATRMLVDDVIAAARPVLPESKVSDSGHFKIFYTKNDANPLNNVTDAQIDNLATILDLLWDKYAANFKEPKHYITGGVKRIAVFVYYIDANTGGQTSSFWKFIELNSDLCVRSVCQRRTFSAHELFHRVQYAYGYESGTANMSWIVEGTAAWSQKYSYQAFRDYMEGMNKGLMTPDLNLITSRSYNACHFWVYLQKLAGTSMAIKDVWAKYEVNGKNAKTAVGSITSARLGMNFDQFAQAWVKTNYIKDLTNATTGSYEYDEDEVTQTSCGVVYGPLSHVPRTAKTVNKNDRWTFYDNVSPYGANYKTFDLGATLTKLQVKITGAATGDFSYHFIGIKGNAWKSIINSTAATYTYTKTLTAGQWDKLALVVAGRSKGGAYTIEVGTPCITGTWFDNLADTWVLQQNGTTITGTLKTPAGGGCGTVPVTGTYNAPNITLYTNTVPAVCCKVTWAGTVTNCDTIIGTWTQTGGASGCTYSGDWSMTKPDGSAAAEPMEMEEVEGPGPAGCHSCN